MAWGGSNEEGEVVEVEGEEVKEVEDMVEVVGCPRKQGFCGVCCGGADAGFVCYVYAG